MPSATPFELPMLSPTKKRQREGENDNRFLFPPSGLETTSLHNRPRKVIPLPVNKRSRLLGQNEEHLQSHNGSPINQFPQQSHFSHAHPEYSATHTSQQHTRQGPYAKALLEPCHICHRKPTKKSDLDSFADCMGCGQRACYICIRACQGWLPPSVEQEGNLSASFIIRDVEDEINQGLSQKQRKRGGPHIGWTAHGHREMVCSRCCVERGPEGDVVCLACLAGMKGA